MGWPKCNATLEHETITEVPLWPDGITFHNLCLVVGGVFALIACGFSFYLIMGHATHYSKPEEQRQNIRILLMIPVYCIVAWVGTFFYKHSVYYSVIGDCYEAFTISAFFALMCHYLAPDLHSQKEYFRGIAPQPWVWPVTWFQKCGGWRKIWRTPRSGLTWFNIIWISVFQYCLLRVLMTILAVVTQTFNLYCEDSLNPAFAHIWVLVIECTSVTIAMYCLIQFFIQVRPDINHHSPFLKILSIKLVVFLSFWQTSLISFLFSSGAIKATDKIQAPDLNVGLPNLLICIEMAIFSVLHLWAFSWKPYAFDKWTFDEVNDVYGDRKPKYYGGFWGLKALLNAFNPLDIVKAVSRGFRWLFVGRKTRMMDPSYQQTPDDAIGLNASEPGTNHATAYEGARGSFTNAGPQPGRYYPDPNTDEEGAVLLSHAQPTGLTSHSTTDVSRMPPPYEDTSNRDLYLSTPRRSGSPSSLSLLEPATHNSRPYSPYDDTENPYLVRSPLDDGPSSQTPLHHHDAPYPTGPAPLNAQDPIPLPESYQPPPLNHDGAHPPR